MQSFQLSSHINSHGVLQIQLPQDLASQDVDIILVVQPKNTPAAISNHPAGQYQGKTKKKNIEKNSQTFAQFLKEFRQEIETEQLDIDTSIFDRDRHTYTDREIEL